MCLCSAKSLRSTFLGTHLGFEAQDLRDEGTRRTKEGTRLVKKTINKGTCKDLVQVLCKGKRHTHTQLFFLALDISEHC